MPAHRRPRRRAGSLGSLRAALNATITYNLTVIEDGTLDHEVRQKASNCLVQAGLAYCRVMEFYELEQQVRRLEAIAGNGHAV